MYNKLKEVRYKNKMTLQQVADLVGISKAYYCQLENGKRRLFYVTAVEIAKVFNVKPDYLFYNDVLDSMKEKD